MSPSIDMKEMDRLRLVALGRISRCGACPRYRALRAAHRTDRRVTGEFPGVPAACTHEICAPLADRYWAESPDGSDWPTAVGQG